MAAALTLAWAVRLEETHELAQRGLAALGDRVSVDRAELLALSSIVPTVVGQYGSMVSLDAAVALAEELRDTVALGHVLFWKGCAHALYMEMERARQTCLRGAEVTRAAGDLWTLASVLGFLSESLVNLGRFDEAIAVDEEARPLAERLWNAGALWHSVMVQGAITFCRTGNLDALEGSARKAIDVCEHAGLGFASWGWSWMALAEFLRGNWDAAVLHAAKAETLAPPTTIIWGVEWALHFEYLAHAGRRDEALAMLDERRTQLPRFGEPAGWGPWLMLVSVVEGLIVLREIEQAAALYPLVRHCMERTGCVDAYPNDCRLLERVAGMAAAAGGRGESAEAHFARALEQAESLPHRPEMAHTQRWYGHFLIERRCAGDLERAHELLEEAVAGYGRMGMPRHEAMARELLAQTGAGHR
jgi:tetratricopeptide (TPR) repeat protein